MSKEIEELQMKELGETRILIDEEKIQDKAPDSRRRFAQLLEYFWKQDEENAAELEETAADTAL